MNRRTFLTAGSLAAAAGTLGPITAARRAQAIEPISRMHGPKFKFTLAAYSYRNLLTGSSPPLALADFVNDCAGYGLEGTELTSYYFPQPVTAEYLCALKAQAFRLGLCISSTAIGNDFCLPPGPKRDAQIAHLKQWIDHAQFMGAPIIRIFSGSKGGDQSVEEAHRLAVEAMQEGCAYAARKGVLLGLENHGGLTATPGGMLKLIHDVQSPWLGAWMDTGNFHGEDVYAELEEIAPYTLHVQVKVFVSPRGAPRQPADFGRLARILAGAGYRGWICLEYEEKEDPRTACPRHIDALRKAFAL